MALDPVSLTLGIAPIVGGMMNSYRAVYRKLRLFGQADRELARLHTILNGQLDVFQNEMHLLLRHVAIDEAIIELMIADGDHEGWKSRKLSRTLEAFYGRSYHSFDDLVHEIKSNTTYLGEELARCSDLDTTTQEAGRGRRERVEQSVHRIGSAARLAFENTKCVQAIQDLRTANNDLIRLREQARDLRHEGRPTGTVSDSSTSPNPRSATIAGRPGSAYCVKIKRAARALHNGLANALPGHQVRLFLDATTVEDITVTNLAIVCGQNRHLDRPKIVRVHSQPTWIPPSPESQDENIVESSTGRRRNRDETSPLQGSSLTVPYMPGTIKDRSTTRPSQNLCSDLCQKKLPSIRHRSQECLCFVEAYDEPFRHEFYLPSSRYPKPEGPHVCLATFDKLLEVPAETAITMVDQLELARSIASAVLYLSSTPWLANYWGAKDLSLFLDDNDLATSLRTLNCGVDLASNQTAEPSGMVDEGLETPPPTEKADTAIEDAMLLHGIRNMTLHSLGVTLLQIGRWHIVQSEDVVQVRKMASQVPRLGPKYQELTEKCLYCDFRCGSNLSKPQLQQAVYEDVVEELNGMIRCLDLDVTLED